MFEKLVMEMVRELPKILPVAAALGFAMFLVARHLLRANGGPEESGEAK